MYVLCLQHRTVLVGPFPSSRTPAPFPATVHLPPHSHHLRHLQLGTSAAGQRLGDQQRGGGGGSCGRGHVSRACAQQHGLGQRRSEEGNSSGGGWCVYVCNRESRHQGQVAVYVTQFRVLAMYVRAKYA